MMHVPETGASKLGADLWHRFLERVSWYNAAGQNDI